MKIVEVGEVTKSRLCDLPNGSVVLVNDNELALVLGKAAGCGVGDTAVAGLKSGTVMYMQSHACVEVIIAELHWRRRTI